MNLVYFHDNTPNIEEDHNGVIDVQWVKSLIAM